MSELMSVNCTMCRMEQQEFCKVSCSCSCRWVLVM